MSKNDMVMVPRELADRIAKICMFTMFKEDFRALSEILANPAEQHQGEPVAVLYANGTVLTKADCGDVFDICCKVETPLYTHAEPGEVERLRGIIRTHEKTVQEQADHLAYMRTKLAERDALLRDLVELGICDTDWAELDDILSRAQGALSASAVPSVPSLVECDACPRSGGCVNTCMKAPASAKPSAPVEIDERAAFETWYIRDVGPGLANLSRINTGSRAYEDEDAMSAWEGWQARAALENKP